jgi:hypothetical protein
LTKRKDIMKWEKSGKIFDPAEHQTVGDPFEFAQSPQALGFPGFIRIYYSARKRSENGKYLSHVRFADFDQDLRQVINVSRAPVIELGKLGCFDEHGIFPMNVLRYKDKIYAYTCGWTRRVSVSVDTGIGLAVSHDQGLTFKKHGDGPVLTSSLDEPFLVGDPFVAVYDGVFHMWYIYGTEWKHFDQNGSPDRIYKIGHAVSPDGISWRKDGKRIITDKYDDESQALPTVIKHREKYHMFFCYRQSYDFRKNRDRGYRIGYACSDDMTKWLRDDQNAGIDVTEGSWDSDMMCYPHVFEDEGKVFLLYNGNEFGRHGFGLARLKEDGG